MLSTAWAVAPAATCHSLGAAQRAREERPRRLDAVKFRRRRPGARPQPLMPLRLTMQAEDAPKILADLLEALIGAVALDEGGFDEAERQFAHIVVPPPDVLAAVAKGEVVVPGNSFGFEGKPF